MANSALKRHALAALARPGIWRVLAAGIKLVSRFKMLAGIASSGREQDGHYTHMVENKPYWLRLRLRRKEIGHSLPVRILDLG